MWLFLPPAVADEPAGEAPRRSSPRCLRRNPSRRTNTFHHEPENKQASAFLLSSLDLDAANCFSRNEKPAACVTRPFLSSPSLWCTRTFKHRCLWSRGEQSQYLCTCAPAVYGVLPSAIPLYAHLQRAAWTLDPETDGPAWPLLFIIMRLTVFFRPGVKARGWKWVFVFIASHPSPIWWWSPSGPTKAGGRPIASHQSSWPPPLALTCSPTQPVAAHQVIKCVKSNAKEPQPSTCLFISLSASVCACVLHPLIRPLSTSISSPHSTNHFSHTPAPAPAPVPKVTIKLMHDAPFLKRL